MFSSLTDPLRSTPTPRSTCPSATSYHSIYQGLSLFDALRLDTVSFLLPVTEQLGHDEYKVFEALHRLRGLELNFETGKGFQIT